jgi:hypothetical protein
MVQERRSLKLNSQEWEHLENLAAQTRSVPARVPNEYKGQSSWRNLIKRIAQGDFLLTPNEEQLEPN